MLVGSQKSTDKRGLLDISHSALKTLKSSINHILKRMGNFWPKSKDNEIKLPKEFKDENYRPIENLPNEIMVEIFSYLDGNEEVKISLVNKRWFQVVNNEIENLSIKWPQQQNQDVQNLINRFPKLKNIELATMITDACMMYTLPVDFFEFTGTLEFDIDPYLIPTKSEPSTYITRIKINPLNPAEEIWDFVYNKNQIINFEIDMLRPTLGYVYLPKHVDSVVEEILSLDNVSKIRYSQTDDYLSQRASGHLFQGPPNYQQEKLKFVKIVQSILSRPYLKQIEFNVAFHYYMEIEKMFPKNFHVEEITLRSNNLSLQVWKNIFDALPNIRKFKVVILFNDVNKLDVILKGLSNFKKLKFLHVTICNHDHYKKFNKTEIRDCFYIIRDNFPMKTEVVIAENDSTKNLIEKEEGKEPKIVIGHSLFSRYFS